MTIDWSISIGAILTIVAYIFTTVGTSVVIYTKLVARFIKIETQLSVLWQAFLLTVGGKKGGRDEG